jgi:hypothetical protein
MVTSRWEKQKMLIEKGMLQGPTNKVEIDSKDDIENTSPKARKKYYKWK